MDGLIKFHIDCLCIVLDNRNHFHVNADTWYCVKLLLLFSKFRFRHCFRHISAMVNMDLINFINHLSSIFNSANCVWRF